METFRPRTIPSLVERHRVTHTQLVPTMFSRLLKLPEASRSRYDLSSLETAIHAAAPCPVPVKQAMIDWWGPIIHRILQRDRRHGPRPSAQRGMAHAQGHGREDGRRRIACSRRPDEGVPAGTTGKLWFKTLSPFEYFRDPVKTAEANSPDRR